MCQIMFWCLILLPLEAKNILFMTVFLEGFYFNIYLFKNNSRKLNSFPRNIRFNKTFRYQSSEYLLSKKRENS